MNIHISFRKEIYSYRYALHLAVPLRQQCNRVLKPNRTDSKKEIAAKIWC